MSDLSVIWVIVEFWVMVLWLVVKWIMRACRRGAPID